MRNGNVFDARMTMLTLDDIEANLIEAAIFDRRLPAVRAPGYQMFWPKIIHDPVDWGYQALQLLMFVGRIDPMNRPVRSDTAHIHARRDVHDLVMMSWLGRKSPLTMQEKTLVWCRIGSGRRTPWRQVAKILSVSHEKARRDYAIALIKLQKFSA